MTTKAQSARASLGRRIRQFYSLLNAGDFAECYRMIDPRVREKAESVTLLQYENALRRFRKSVGSIEVLQIRDLALHLDEPNKLYEGRAFALGKTIWVDSSENRFDFSERWVCENSIWYTRSTGFIKPSQPISAESSQKDDRVNIAKNGGPPRPKAKPSPNSKSLAARRNTGD